MNLIKLQREAHAIAKEKGWWDVVGPTCQCGQPSKWDPSVPLDSTPGWYCDGCGGYVDGSSYQSRLRAFGDLIALVHSELSEALKAYRDFHDVQLRRRVEAVDTHKVTYVHDLPDFRDYEPVGVPMELANVVIRVADMAENYGVDLDFQVNRDKPIGMGDLSFGAWITFIHYYVSEISHHHMMRNDRWHESIKTVIAFVWRMAAYYGIDLDAAIKAKMEIDRGTV